MPCFLVLDVVVVPGDVVVVVSDVLAVAFMVEIRVCRYIEVLESSFQELAVRVVTQREGVWISIRVLDIVYRRIAAGMDNPRVEDLVLLDILPEEGVVFSLLFVHPGVHEGSRVWLFVIGDCVLADDFRLGLD